MNKRVLRNVHLKTNINNNRNEFRENSKELEENQEIFALK